MDDCSKDESRSILASYSMNSKVTHIVYNEVNSGNTFYQWEKGIELARGEYIWIAEADDYCERNFLETTCKLLDQNPEVSLVYCTSHRVNENGDYMDDLSFWYNDLSPTKWRNSFKNNGKKEVSQVLAIRNTIPNASAVLFRKCSNKANWNELKDYKLSGDWLFWIYLLEGGDILYTTSTINYFRTHTGSVRSNTESDDTVEKEKKRILKYLEFRQLISHSEYKKITSINKNTQASFYRRVKNRFLRLLII